jgi:hypothetical protein
MELCYSITNADINIYYIYILHTILQCFFSLCSVEGVVVGVSGCKYVNLSQMTLVLILVKLICGQKFQVHNVACGGIL